MKRQTSLGDFISALYDSVDASGRTQPTSEVVAACTIELLWRQRKRSVLAAILGGPDLVLH
jgi:hypothetical protein